VWSNQQFWEAAFFLDVQKDIKALYAPRSDPHSSYSHHKVRLGADSAVSPVSPREVTILTT